MGCHFCDSTWLAVIRLKMSKVYTYDGKILEGWEKVRTANGVPYFVNHATELTQWDHPLLSVVMEELSDYQIVKYSTYRMALKLRSIQKILKMHLVTTETLIKIFNQFIVKPLIIQSTMSCAELESFLCDIFNLASLDQPLLTDSKISAELAANFLLNLFDSNRTGFVKVCSVFVGLLVLSVGKLHEKYKFMFRLFANHNNCISRKNLTFLLHVLAEIPEYLKEKIPFGKSLVDSAVESCFTNNSGLLGITEETFLSWILKEPHTLIWIPIFFRVVIAESITHGVKCCVCKMYPILGLRYRCLHCFNYDLCQHCFFTGQTSKGHKLKHPIQEYCTEATSKEDRQVLMKRIGNKFKIKKPKQSYLPLDTTQMAAAEDEVFENCHAVTKETQTSTKVLPYDELGKENSICTVVNGMPVQAFLASQQSELESVIVHLEQQHKILHSEVGNLQDISPASSSSDDGQSTTSRQSEVNRQEVLLDHDKQLELQLRRLKRILRSFRKICKKTDLEIEKKSQETPNAVRNIQLEERFSSAVKFTSTPTQVTAEIHLPPKEIQENSKNSTSADQTNSEIKYPPLVDSENQTNGQKENVNAVNSDLSTQSDSYSEMNAIQAELESIMAHLEGCFPSSDKLGCDKKTDSDELMRAAMDVGNILSDFVDKVRVPDSNLRQFSYKIN